MKKPFQSEERIKARFAAYNEKRRRQLQAAAGSALLPEELEMMLEDQLHITLTRRDKPLPLFKVQMSMLTDLVISEHAVAHYKKKKEERQSQFGNDLQPKDTLEKEFRFIDREIHFHQAICRAIRDIGDGIAWRLFDYDRVTLSMIANRPASKHINMDGLEPELIEFSRAFDSSEGAAILNDLTNFLKLADVTIRKDNGTFELVEVKAGHKSSGRITRQKQNLRRTVALLNSGAAPEEELTISQLEVIPESYIRNIAKLIQNAEKRGAAIERIGDSMVVECTDFEKASEMGLEPIKDILKQGREYARKWEQAGDMVIDLGSQEKYLEVKNYVPYSIYPLREKTRVKLMTGSLFLVSYLNVSSVLRYIRGRGWNIVKTPEEHLDEYRKVGTTELATVRKGPLTSAIPLQLFGRIALEFLKPKSLVDILEARLSSGPTETVENLVNLTGEAHVWD